MKQYFVIAAAALVLTSLSAVAQEGANAEKPGREKKVKPLNDKRLLNEYDEIIIKRKKPEGDTRVTIEIKDDQVLVDGKPIEDFRNEELSVQKRSMNRYRMATPASPFRFEGGDWIIENEEAIGEDRAFLGVMTEGSSNGARIERVTENSAAAKAGLKTGDVITRINDKEIFDHEGLSDAISGMKPGDEVNITYKRDNKENKARATLGKKTMPIVRNRVPDALNMPPMHFEFDGQGFNQDFDNVFEMRNRPRLGIKAQDTEDGSGVKVLEVEEGSAAEKAGIREEDIIISFEGKAVKSAAELARASREAKEKSTLKVDLKRNGKPQTIEVKIPKKLKTANL